MGDHGLHRLSLRERRAWLYQPRRRQARPGSDRSGQGGRELRVRSCRPLSDHRTDHGARTRVPSSATTVTVQAIYDAESIAFLVRWHDMSADKTGKNGPSLPVPPEEEEEPAQPQPREDFGERVAPARPRPRRGSPLPRRRRAGRPAIRVLRRRLDPDSFAGADGRPQALLHLRRRPELGGSLVLRSGPPRALQFTGRGSADIAPNDTGDLTGVASYDQGEWSVIFKRPLRASSGAAVLARRVHADRLLGLGRVLARAWQPARSHGLVFHLRRAARWSHRPSARWSGRRSSFSSSSWP